MPHLNISTDTINQLADELGPNHPAIETPTESLMGNVLPRHFAFSPDMCFRRDQDYLLIHATPSPEIPKWVRKAREQVSQKRNIKIVILALNSTDMAGQKIAGGIAEDVRALGFGLAAQTADGTHMVFPAHYRNPRAISPPRLETGHIPSWVYQRVIESEGLSTYLRDRMKSFIDKYLKAIEKNTLSYDRESRIMFDLAHDLAEGDPRLLFPLERLHAFQSYERCGQQQTARDHIFHTFNNFFLGLIILGRMFRLRDRSAFPDRIIPPKRGQSNPHTWETLWFLTSMFHDPGYLGKDFWSLMDFGYGMKTEKQAVVEVPDEVRERIINSWDTTFRRTRNELKDIYKMTVDHISGAVRSLSKFDDAMRGAYFNGNQSGHSVISALGLVHQCLSDGTVKDARYDKKLALAASKISALSILFHDRTCRNALSQGGVPPLAFETLPYASVLMFVDALQDERRDTSQSRFPKVSILKSLHVDPDRGIVTARIQLHDLAMQYWPEKITEYVSVMNWINTVSHTKFIIDYRSGMTS